MLDTTISNVCMWFLRALCALFSDIFLQTAKPGCEHVLIIWFELSLEHTRQVLYQGLEYLPLSTLVHFNER